MADYPPTPAFGMAPSRAMPPYHRAAHQGMYDGGDAVQAGASSTLEYHKAQTRAAFKQNATFPGFSADSVASGIPPLPIYEGHENLAYVYSTKSYGHNRTFEPSRSQNSYDKPSNLSPHALPPNVPHERNHKRLLSHTSAQNVEEGELSEGEFEEGHPNVNRNVAGMSGRHGYYEHQRDTRHLPTYRGAYNGSDGREVNSTAQLTDMYGRSLDLNRPRSESYSPYEPPNEMEYEHHSAQEILAPRRQLSNHEEYEPPEEFLHMPNKHRQNEYHSESSRVESVDSPDRNHREQKSLLANMDMPLGPDAPGLSSATKSLHDARKEAQNAILNLLPLKVRYHDYLEEGIDEEVVRRQFESLGVPLAPTEILAIKTYGKSLVNSPSNQGQSTLARKELFAETFTSNPEASQASRYHVDDSASQHGTLTFSENTSSHITKDSDRTLVSLNSAESRKDRIARLLAEKKKKQRSPVMQSDSSLHSASPEASTFHKVNATSQLAAKADKERLLRRKMEALQKSREQRAQKAAAKSATVALTATTDGAKNILVQKPARQSLPGIQQAFELPPPEPNLPAQVVSKQVMPSIPGLFLASGPNTAQGPASHITAPNTVQNGTQRKRPVASDFDRPSSTASSHKRPFGQSRNDQPLVIDVSDDDSDDGHLIEMKVDQPQLVGSDNNAQYITNSAKANHRRELPPLSDFPPRKPFAASSSATSTPLTPQPSKTPVSKPEDLHRKELEIQDMKRKIAEAERRKRAKQNLSGSQTPRSNDSTSSPAKNNGVSLAEKIEASVQIEHLIDDASRQVDQDQQKLAEAHAEERAKEDELKRSEAERRRLRRAEIASNLPVVDAEVEQAQKQLADLRAEMARIEAAVQKGLDDKKSLAEEMAKLGQEADEQLQAQREKLDELKVEEAREIIESTQIKFTRSSSPVSDQAVDNYPVTTPNNPSLVEESVESAISDVQPILNLDLQGNVQPEIGHNVVDAEFFISSLNSTETSIKSVEPKHNSSLQSSLKQALSNKHDEPSPHITPDQALEAALQEATAQAESQSDEGSVSEVEMVDSLGPAISNLASTSAESPSESSQQDNGLTESSEEPMDVADGESDQYEPPEATPPPVDAISSSDSPPFSPAPPEAIPGSTHAEKQHDDISTSLDEPTVSKATAHADGLALPINQTNQNLSYLASRKTFFTPYESPLKNFRAFRFHPTFEQEVYGGFKSITYSNNIKNDKELCRYELAGGVCNDASCEFQHFRDMGLADDAILVELGNSAGYSEEDKPRFVAGLRTVLQGLRAKKTKDFHIIASEIAAYRARFLGDKSKILLLENIPT